MVVACFCGAVFKIIIGKAICPKCGKVVPNPESDE